MPLRFAQTATESYSYPLTIRHLLERALITSGTNKIFYKENVSFTYSEFFERVKKQASMLASLGAEQGETIAIMDWDSHRYLEAYFAIPMMGSVLQTVNVRLPVEQIIYTLERTNPSIVVIHQDFFCHVDAIREALPSTKSIIAIIEDEEVFVPGWADGEYEELLAEADPGFEFQDFDENAIATTFFTTGTTGNPKGVCFSHRQLVLHTIALCGHSGDTRHRGFGVDDVYMPLTPMFHVHAWGMPYIATMLGLNQVYPGRYDPELICKLRTQYKVSYSHGVPTILQMLIAAADRTNTDLSGWMMVVGGSNLTTKLFEEGRRRGMEIVTAYGMSETAPIISMARRTPGIEADVEEESHILTKAGPPIPFVSAKIVDEDMNALPNDGSSRGELVVRAPWLTACYVDDEEGSKALWRGGWLHTQDVATIDENGIITIRDRLKDVIKSGGEWIDSLLLEGLIAGVSGISETAVIAVPDEKWGERPLAVVVPREGAKLTLDLLNQPILSAVEMGKVTRYAILDRFKVMDELPRTSVGKIDKKRLRETFSSSL